MDEYKIKLARTLAENGALFFREGLVLKDGRTTPYFVNMAMFKTGRLSLQLGSFFASMMISKGLVKDIDIILGPSYKGSSIALATSIALWQEYGIDLPFDFDRKEAKLHGEATLTRSTFVNGTFFDGCRIFVVDDVATSMGTKYDLLKKIEDESRAKQITLQVTGIGILVDREQTTAVTDSSGKVIHGQKGENAIQDFVSKSRIPVHAVAGITEIIRFLYQEQVPVLIQGRKVPIDEKTKAAFEEYIRTYGVE